MRRALPRGELAYMNDVRRRYVIPGDKIVEGNYRPIMNVVRSGNALIATRIGIAEAGRDGVKVNWLGGTPAVARVRAARR